MTGQLVLQPVTTVWPIHRKQLLEEVLASSNNGDLDRLWVTRGHVFVTLDQGRKLLTFDVKPVGIGQDYQFGNLGCLDLADIHPPLVDILYCQALSAVILVQRNGHVQVWKFLLSSYKWERLVEDNLCTDESSVVTSICLLEKSQTVYWCEREARNAEERGAIWKRDLHKNIEVGFGEPVKVLENSPLCELSPLSRGVFASIRKSKRIIGLVFFPHSNTVSLYEVDGVHTYKAPETFKCLDFRDIILPYLAKHGTEDVGEVEQVLHSTNHVFIVTTDGNVRLLSEKEGVRTLETAKDGVDSLESDSSSTRCFIYRDYIARVTSDKIILHNYHTGEVVKHSLSEPLVDGVEIHSISPTPYFPTMMTDSGLKALQIPEPVKSVPSSPDVYLKELQNPTVKVTNVTDTAEMVCKSYLQGSSPKVEFAVDGKRFQNPALVITMLDQLQDKLKDPSMTKQRLSILENYTKKTTYQHTRYNETIGPYLNEYLRIEKICTDRLTPKQNSGELIVSNDCVKDETLALIDPSSCLTAPDRQAQLEQLARDHPEIVLVTLMHQLDIQSEDLSDEEMEKWSSVLASENIAMSGYSGGTFSLYEIITRLLFLQKPNQLVNFVHIAQLIHDKHIGVSAFIRKRQTFQFYERALSCFPPPGNSRDVDGAVQAKAQLLLAMQTRTSLIQAVQLLVRYKQWEVVLAVLRENADHSQAHQEIFYILLTAISQSGVLGKYCTEVLELRPENTSFVSVLEMIGSQRKDDHSITSPKDIFCRGTGDVELGEVKDIFLSMVQNQNIDKSK